MEESVKGPTISHSAEARPLSSSFRAGIPPIALAPGAPAHPMLSTSARHPYWIDQDGINCLLLVFKHNKSDFDAPKGHMAVWSMLDFKLRLPTHDTIGVCRRRDE